MMLIRLNGIEKKEAENRYRMRWREKLERREKERDDQENFIKIRCRRPRTGKGVQEGFFYPWPTSNGHGFVETLEFCVKILRTRLFSCRQIVNSCSNDVNKSK